MQLRKIYHISNTLKELNNNSAIKVGRNLVLRQEAVISDAIAGLVYFRQTYQPAQFKFIYLQSILKNLLPTLSNLYRRNFLKLDPNPAIIQQFASLLEIEDEAIKTSVCELMRVFLLKGERQMASC